MCNSADKEGSVITITSRLTQLALLAAKSLRPVTEQEHRTTHATGLHIRPFIYTIHTHNGN